MPVFSTNAKRLYLKFDFNLHIFDIRYGLDSFTILDLLFYYYFNVICKAHLNIFI